MNITFLIGNGFDINLGLKTRYSDFYNYYKEQSLENDMILKWMNEDEDKGRWADLETALGLKIEELDENNKDLFLDTFAELEALLLEYLEMEQRKYYISDEAVISEIGRSLRKLPDELSLEEQRSYKATCRIPDSEELRYCFISYNYTNILDQIIEKARTSNLDYGSHITMEGHSKKIL